MSCMHPDKHTALQENRVYCAANEIWKKGGLDLNESELEDETDSIQMNFKTLVTRTRLDMEKQGLTPKDIADHLEDFPELEPVYSDTNKPPFNEKIVEEIRNKTTLVDVFRILLGYCSWFNYRLIENLIKTFCAKSQDVKEELEVFKASFSEYSERRVFAVVPSAESSERETEVREKVVHIAEFGSDRKCDVKKFILKMDKRWKKITVKELERIIINVAGILRVNKRTLYLRTVEKGCFQMTFLIPEFVAATVFPLKFPAEQKTALLEAGVIELHCDGYDLELSTPSKESQDSDPEVYPTSKYQVKA